MDCLEEVCLHKRKLEGMFSNLEKIGEGPSAVILRKFLLIVAPGTFSTVYKAECVATPGQHVALKCVHPTSMPWRVLTEIENLEMLRGENNVIGIYNAYREQDLFTIALPYFEHEDYKAYLSHISLQQIQCYMRELFTALRHVHSLGIIHRDIKPRNFLFSLQTCRGMLVDFGMCQRQEEWKPAVERLRRIREELQTFTKVHPETGRPKHNRNMRNRTAGNYRVVSNIQDDKEKQEMNGPLPAMFVKVMEKDLVKKNEAEKLQLWQQHEHKNQARQRRRREHREQRQNREGRTKENVGPKVDVEEQECREQQAGTPKNCQLLQPEQSQRMQQPPSYAAQTRPLLCVVTPNRNLAKVSQIPGIVAGTNERSRCSTPTSSYASTQQLRRTSSLTSSTSAVPLSVSTASTTVNSNRNTSAMQQLRQGRKRPRCLGDGSLSLTPRMPAADSANLACTANVDRAGIIVGKPGDGNASHSSKGHTKGIDKGGKRRKYAVQTPQMQKLKAEHNRPSQHPHSREKRMQNWKKAERAGTAGFRAPETLMQCLDQTTAIDVWAAGVMLLCLLSRRYPVFSVPDRTDLTALMQICAIFGDKPIKKVAASLGKKIWDIPPVRNVSKTPLEDFCKYACKGPNEELARAAFDFLYKCLDLDPTSRITAEDALLHRFLLVPEKEQ